MLKGLFHFLLGFMSNGEMSIINAILLILGKSTE